MRTQITLLTSLFFCSAVIAQYYDFPSCGWVQAMEMIDARPDGWVHNFNIKKYEGDTLINSTEYKVITESYFPNKKSCIRQENGRIYRY